MAKPIDLDEAERIGKAAVQFDTIDIVRYDHGGGRFLIERPRLLVADFYEKPDREFYAYALENWQAMIGRLRALEGVLDTKLDELDKNGE